jgi:hypothetical protein
MWDCPDSQEVGLEAATLERVRNSSLVEWSCADNVTGLKYRAEAASFLLYALMGRGASISAVKRPRERSWSVVECECRHE